MTKKIFKSVFVTALASLLAACALIMAILCGYFGAVQKNALNTELKLACSAVESGGLAYLDGLEVEDIRLTWIAADGTVLFDSEGDAQTMENHSDREEFIEALESGEGESSRYSSTLTEQTLYRARLLSDGTVLRASVSRMTALTLALGMLQPVLVVILVALILSALLAKRLSANIVRPLSELDLERPLEGESYEELAPVMTRLEKQRRQIGFQQEELQKRENEFQAVVGSMREGLVLLNAEGAILSMNAAAGQFFGASPESCVGKDILSVDRSPELSRAIEDAREAGSGEAEAERRGRVYRVNASRTETDGRGAGAALLIFDETEKVFAERNRREFTANVSHELKTPLQTITGGAELMENGLVKQEDVPEFAGKIRAEAGRLMALIEDIIRLSQLDEHAAAERESVELLALCGSEADALRPAAEKRGVTLSVGGDRVELFGVRQLLHEIVYNLCDNAIKYNVDGGSVTVTVSKAEGEARISVADTGVGIPPEHQDRIFERFYRVDKSRSKELGGTGLGLSIVKHAVEYHGGRIALKSEPGNTVISVYLPLATDAETDK